MDDIAQCYAFPCKNEENSDAMIQCTILVYNLMVNLLFDLSSTYSYVSMRFAYDLEILHDILDDPIYNLPHLACQS